MEELSSKPWSRGLLDTRLLVAIGAIFLAQTLWQWYRLSHIPGPFWAGFSRFWFLKEAIHKRTPMSTKRASDQYGSLVRVGPNSLLTDDPEVLRKMMAVRSPYTKSRAWYQASRFDPSRDHLVSLCDEAEHARLRSKMAAGYSGKENEAMDDTIDGEIAKFITLIETKYLSTDKEYRPMDLGEKGQYFALDVISNLAFGKAFGYLEQDRDPYDYINISQACLSRNWILLHFPLLTRILQSRLLKRLAPNEMDKLGFGAFIGVANAFVAERFASNAVSRRDMLASFIKHGLTQEEASAEALLQILAGSDTSATAIRVVLLHLIGNPVAYKRLVSEIDEAIAAKSISSPIKDVEAREMPYLQAVIKEGLRIIPPVSAPFFKQVPPEGDVINGMFIPGNTAIGSSMFAIQRSTKTFGPDADIFRPERWLEADGAKFVHMASTVDMVFHYGKYQCLGKPVALMEFNKIFVELLRRFDFSFVNPGQPAVFKNIGLWVIEDFWVRITRREELAGLFAQ